jgi:hypothetical protein
VESSHQSDQQGILLLPAADDAIIIHPTASIAESSDDAPVVVFADDNVV